MEAIVYLIVKAKIQTDYSSQLACSLLSANCEYSIPSIEGVDVLDTELINITESSEGLY